MLALIYFALAACVGDFLCRRFYQFESAAHRCAAAILVGLLVSSWFTYLAGLAFFWTPQPLLWANLLFFVAAVALLSWPKWKGRILKSTSGEAYSKRSNLYLPRPRGIEHSRLATHSRIRCPRIVDDVCLVQYQGGKLQIANPEYSDFGPNTALMQSFAVGHNFPNGVSALLRRPHSLPFLVLLSGGKSGIPRTQSSVELESTQHNHTRGDARDRHDARGGAFQFARSRTPWVAALFLFRIALLRPVSSKASFSSRGNSKRSHINGTIFRRSFRIAAKLEVHGLR